MQRYVESVNKHRQLILDAMDYIWKNPETGYKEEKACAKQVEFLEKLRALFQIRIMLAQ